jgi:hypothetical protein
LTFLAKIVGAEKIFFNNRRREMKSSFSSELETHNTTFNIIYTKMPKTSPWGTVTSFTEKKHPKEWKKLVNTIIDQDLWDPEIHKPNDIHQLDTDFHKFDSNCFGKAVKSIRNRKESK